MSKENRGPQPAGVQYVFSRPRRSNRTRKHPRDGTLPDGRSSSCCRGSPERIAGWKPVGTQVICRANQRGVALGVMTEAELQGINDRLRAEHARDGARLDAIYYCPHHRNECECRKPRTGMIEAAFRDFPGAGPENSVLIGDSLSDLECGRAAGMATIFIARDEDRDGAAITARKLGARAVVSSLAAASLLLG